MSGRVAKAKINARWQVTVPEAVRDSLALRPGDEIEFINGNGRLSSRRVVDSDVWLRYSGFLRDLAGQDPDDLIEEMRGR